MSTKSLVSICVLLALARCEAWAPLAARAAPLASCEAWAPLATRVAPRAAPSCTPARRDAARRLAPRAASLMMSDDAGRRPIDLVARGLQSPAVSLTVSGVIVSWLVVNRFLLDEVANSQSRSDLLATVAFSVLVLRALSALDIDTRVAEPQQLIGTRVECELTGTGVERADEFLRWLGTTLLACTPTSSIVIYDRARQQTLLRSGVMGPDADVSPGPILEKCLTVDRARGTYLASLQNYPGRFEFKCLPPNTQCVLVQPYGDGRGVIILGANVAKVYTVKHLSWVQLVADRLAAELGRAP